MNVAGGELEWASSLNDSQFQRSLNNMDQRLNGTTNNIINQGNQIESYAKKAAAAVAGFLSIQAAQGFVSSLVSVRGEFQQLEIAFSTMLKSKQKADDLMKDIVQFAATTPFGLQQTAAGAKQLLAYGFAAKDMKENLSMLGNVASGVGSQIGDLIYLFGTLKASGRVTQMDINQFAGRGIPIYDALSKVLKVNVDQVRDFVSAGKVGFPQVEQAFKDMTSSTGMFYRLMEEQSKSLTGQISNLGDAWDSMLNDIGKSNEGVFSSAISAAADLVENYEKVIEAIELLIITYGVYRAALIVTAINQRIVAEGQLQMALSGNTLAASQLRAAGAASVFNQALVRIKTTLLSFAGATAPIAVLAALVTVGYALVQYQDAAEIAENSLTEARERGSRAVENETVKINDLIAVIKNHNATNKDRKEAYEGLQQTTY